MRKATYQNRRTPHDMIESKIDEVEMKQGGEIRQESESRCKQDDRDREKGNIRVRARQEQPGEGKKRSKRRKQNEQLAIIREPW